MDRYAQPTAEELADMFHEPTAGECLTNCKHSGACLRLLESFRHVSTDEGVPWDDVKDRLAEMLGCDDCGEYE